MTIRPGLDKVMYWRYRNQLDRITTHPWEQWKILLNTAVTHDDQPWLEYRTIVCSREEKRTPAALFGTYQEFKQAKRQGFATPSGIIDPNANWLVVGNSIRLPFVATDDDALRTLHRLMESMYLEGASHEFDEWFRVDGEIVMDPHAHRELLKQLERDAKAYVN